MQSFEATDSSTSPERVTNASLEAFKTAVSHDCDFGKGPERIHRSTESKMKDCYNS
jgi:hypothetical protein